MAGLHDKIKTTAMNGLLILDSLKPNSREVASRMITDGQLVQSRCKRGYVWQQVKRVVHE